MTTGYYIFKPVVVEGRVKRLQEQGVDVGAVGRELKREEEIAAANARERLTGTPKEA